MNRLSFALSVALVAAPAIASAQYVPLPISVSVAPAANAANPNASALAPCHAWPKGQQFFKPSDFPICTLADRDGGGSQEKSLDITAEAPESTGWKLRHAMSITLVMGSGYTATFNVRPEPIAGFFQVDIPLPCNEKSVKSITFGPATANRQIASTDRDPSNAIEVLPANTWSDFMCENKSVPAIDYGFHSDGWFGQ